jgi:hypothetical protein
VLWIGAVALILRKRSVSVHAATKYHLRAIARGGAESLLLLKAVDIQAAMSYPGVSVSVVCKISWWGMLVGPRPTMTLAARSPVDRNGELQFR